MHSLKQLRAENAARRLSNNRTADEDEGQRTPLAVGAATSSTGVPAPAATSRAGRTLAPIGSAGSLLPSGTAAPAEAAASRAPVEVQGDMEAEGRGAARDAAAGEKSEVQPRGGGRPEQKGEPTQRQPGRRSPPSEASSVGEEKVPRDPRNAGAGSDDESREKPPLSARGAPPSEKPRKSLTPLEARRARIEQQKREEVEREAGSSGQSPRSIGSGQQPRENREAKTDTRPQGGAIDIDGGRRRVDERGPRTDNSDGTNRSGQPRKRDNSPERGGSVDPNIEEGAEGITTSKKTDEGDEGVGKARSPLLSDGNVVQRPPNLGNQDRAGDQAESANEGKPTGGRKQGPSGANEAGAAALESGADGLSDNTVGVDGVDGGDAGDAGDGGRFQGMRSRMKKAGKGIMAKKVPAPSARGEKEGDDDAGVGISEKKEQQPGLAERRSAGNASPGTGDAGGRAGSAAVTRRNEGVGGRGVKERNPSGGRADGSDIEGEASKEEGFDTGTDESDNGKEKKWRRNKNKGSADLPQSGDKEVTLGHVVDRKMREMGYIRKPPVDELKNRRSLRDRVAAEEAPEVHFIGEISGAEGFGSGICCRFRVEGGRHWTCLAGLEEGQTHVMDTGYGEAFAPWNHPIDLHYTTKSIQGWPRLMLQVWQLDTHGRNVLRGYGFRHLPSSPGFSEVSVPCWRPSGTMQEETAAFFLGVTPRLAAEDAVFNRAWDQRCRLVTLPAGTVWMQMNGMFRNMQNQGVDTVV
ncbi:unnamed protein product [Scytosiphon promiscuus]